MLWLRAGDSRIPLRIHQIADSAAELGKKVLVIVDHALTADHGREINHHAELCAPGSEVSKQLFVTLSAAKYDHAAFAGCMNTEEQFETFKFVFFRHGATFPEFDELGVGRLLHVDVIELDVSQIKLHDFCDEHDNRMMSIAESLSKDAYKS